MTPATYQCGGAGTKITLGIAPCALGFLLVAATPQGICSITLGDAPDELENALRGEFPKAEIKRDDGELKNHLQTLVRHLEGSSHISIYHSMCKRRRFSAAFGRNYAPSATVKRALIRKWHRRLVSRPPVRRVARACATNPVALAIPCHRVVREGGALAGYRWGIERKKAILERESGK